MLQPPQIPDLSGKTALVTGASRGIGRAIALSLAKAGAHVLAVARTAGGLEELDDEIREADGKCSLIPMDLTQGNGVEQLAASLADRFQTIDIVVCNAASLGELAPLEDVSAKAWQQTLDLNVTVNWRLLRALAPLLNNAAAPHVLFMTSRIGGEVPRAYWGPYAISKAALEMLAQTYAEEKAASNTKVTILDPGRMRTNMRAQAMPGEDPSTLPDPMSIEPLLYQALSTQNDQAITRLSMRKWLAEQEM